MRAGGRRIPVAITAVACAAIVALTGCSPGRAARPATSRVLPAGARAVLGAGTLYLLLGDVAISANLWREDLRSGWVRQLTFNRPLVTSRNRQQIGIWDPASPGQVRNLGRLPGAALQECSWTARPAPGT